MRVSKLVGVTVATVWAGLLGVPAPSASAEPCPDVEVIFARGTGEPPGVGGVGQSFVDALRSQAGGKSVGVYPVNYAASGDFNDTMAFAADRRRRNQGRGRSCPVHGGELPQYPDRARRLLAGRGGGGIRDLG